MNQKKPGRTFIFTLISIVSCLVGIVLGILFQRFYGAGNTLRTVGLLSYPPTPTPMPTSTPLGVPVEFQGKLSLFILAGQSNMSGYSEIPQNQAINPKVFLFGNDYRWKVAAEPIDSPIDQVDEVSRDGAAGFSPGLAFATTLIEQEPALVIGLIPCAKGASAIKEWQRNLSDTTLYGSCLKRIRAASPMGEIVGLLFFQGESDALDPDQYAEYSPSAFDYAAKFSAFVTDFRNDLVLPNLPLIFAQIGSNTGPEAFINWQVIKEQQASVTLPCTAMITTDDLPLRDGVHFSTESYGIIGERFAEAYVDLTMMQHCK